ncbi:MAG: cellulase family glycosylhydrolase [Spirochaetales bacterium]|nr:cellulase family glycosylhydrolase [Spirochaetales bacterium]
MKGFVKIVIAVLLMTALFTCQVTVANGPPTGPPGSQLSGSVVFVIGSSNMRAALSLDDVAALVVTIENSNGQVPYSTKKVELYGYNGEFYSQELQLPVGDYELTRFLVVDNENNILFLTPLEGSLKDYAVSEPLPLLFSVTEESAVTVEPEVMEINGPLADYGYAGFDINVVSDTMLKNGNFNSESSDWAFWTNDTGVGSMVIENGEMLVLITDPGSYPWSAAVSQSGLTIEDGAGYSVTFQARADVPTTISLSLQMDQDPWTQYSGNNFFNLTTEMNDFSYSFTMWEPTDTAAGFQLRFGGPHQNASNIYIDNVVMQKTSNAPEGIPASDGLLDPFTQNQLLSKCMNMGNYLESPPPEGSWYNGDGQEHLMEEYFFNVLKQKGFTAVRIPIRFSAYAANDYPYTIQTNLLERVDEVVNWALHYDLAVIIDMHHYLEIMENPSEHKARFIAMWKQIAERYKNYSDNVFFELLNEPMGNLNANRWNEYLYDCLFEVRKIDNHHTVIIDSADWASVDALGMLHVPESETNTIISFHYYHPMIFTTQGASWVPYLTNITGIIFPGPPSEPYVPPADTVQWVKDWINEYNTVSDPDLNPSGYKLIRDHMDYAYQWSINNNRPLFMGEFGVISHVDIQSQVNWLVYMRTQMEAKGIAWAYWNFSSSHRIYDIENQVWIEELTQALGL